VQKLYHENSRGGEVLLKHVNTKIYRELKKLNSPKFNDSMKKRENALNRAFSKEEVQMAKKHMKKCSISLAIKEMQIKTMLRIYLTPVSYHQEHKQQMLVRMWGKRNPHTLLMGI
jgi:hypothetical protein